MNMLYMDLRMGMEGIHTLHQYLFTQMPFPYVHMITLLVNIHNLVVAFVGGLTCGVRLHSKDGFGAMAQLLQVLIVPSLYQGLMLVCRLLSDPMGDDIIDFPIMDFQ